MKSVGIVELGFQNQKKKNKKMGKYRRELKEEKT